MPTLEEKLAYKLIDFGARGCSSYETSALGGMAHLVNFMGTDTIAGVVAARKYYGEYMAGHSIPAAEHSTITSWGQEHEIDAYRNMLQQFAKPGSLVAIVSDSYDIYNAVENIWGKELRQEVIDSGATVIIRPDSGNPTDVVLECVQLLDEAFGSVLNAKGYKVLNHVRVIQGDGITADTIDNILSTLQDEGYSADNIAFGMGGTLLQAPMRDDYGWAMKCSAAKINGKWVDVFKNPITDSFKKSKKGRFAVVEQHGIGSSSIRTISEDELTTNTGLINMLETVYENGRLIKETTFAEVRSRASL